LVLVLELAVLERLQCKHSQNHLGVKFVAPSGKVGKENSSDFKHYNLSIFVVIVVKVLKYFPCITKLV